jgi:ParB family chromosome partitioning protein
VTAQRRGLGRGLSALIPGGAEEGGLIEVPVEGVSPNPRQPRGGFDEASLEGLARSIREVGVLQPIVVRRLDGGYELVAGERRLRAAQLAGLATVPAIIRDTEGATESLREALIENIHRQDLSPLEQAAAFQELQEDLGLSQEALAQRLGHSRPHVANTIRLLQLPPEVQNLLADGSLQAGHARALLALEDREAQKTVALRVAAEGLSVRQVEALVKGYSEGRAPRAAAPARPRDARLLQAEEALADALETRVSIRRSRRKGKIVIDFGSRADMDRIVARIVG